VDETESLSCPIISFGISDVKRWGSVSTVIVTQLIYRASWCTGNALEVSRLTRGQVVQCPIATFRRFSCHSGIVPQTMPQSPH
jgi:hypothetical protein